MPERRSLTATYRLQLNAGFTLAQVRARVDYFAHLGVSHLYCSPLLAARRGSMHGYDVVDPTRLNPEIGTEADLRDLAADLHARGMGILLDIVPNHMGIGAENPYWDDVLAHGEWSRYARWFDIDWTPRHGEHRKLVVPVLGDELDRVLARGELSVEVHEGQTPRVIYFNQSFPIDPASIPPELQLATFDPEETGELAELFSGTAGRDRLRALLDVQHYRLASWKRAANEINYRRFFDVNDLVGLRMEDEQVFRETHAFILRLVHDDLIDGVRIDHVDGLVDPLGYLRRLRTAVGPDTAIVVEKILSPNEHLRQEWPVEGTTGYEFLNDLEDVYIDAEGYEEVERCYRRLRRLGDLRFQDIVVTAKKSVLEGALHAEIDRLAGALAVIRRRAAPKGSHPRDGMGDIQPDEILPFAGRPLAGSDLRAGLVEFIASLPVYRTYIDDRSPVHDDDRAVIESAARDVQARAPASAAAVAFLVDVLLDRLPHDGSFDAAARLHFVQRLQQVTGPAAAKGIEDTALYVYVPLVSRNEVGGAPDRPLSEALDRLHHGNARRAAVWPHGLVATNTHDTKRSADVRARLDALSEFPLEWARAIQRWRRLNAKHRRTVHGRMAPGTNDEYLVYETLVAIWPPPRAGRRSDDLPDRTWRDAARTRISRYMRKAAREAKLRTSWVEPDSAYEGALDAFIAAVLEPREDAPFLSDVARIVARIAPMAAWNSLSRIVVHLTSPGIPDIYQGDELWNFALVDPDNRRPVDYAQRASMLSGDGLASLEEQLHAIQAIQATQTFHERSGSLPDPFDNRLKLLVTRRLLEMRRAHAPLFGSGEYERLPVRGTRAGHVVAYARHRDGRHAITIAPRLVRTMPASNAAEWWADTAVEVPRSLHHRQWHSQIVPGEVVTHGHPLELGALLRALPMAVLVS